METLNTTNTEIQVEDVRLGGRWAEVGILAMYREMDKAGMAGISLANVARKLEIPESTLRYWVNRAKGTNGPSAWSNFFESPEGLQLLHQIVIAARYILTQVVGGGIRSMCQFLELSGLWRFIAPSYGTESLATKEMEEYIVKFGKQQQERLAPKMSPKQITLTEDETFHASGPCLVASEPVSNFILVEEYANDRKTSTWDAKVQKGLDGLPVKVIQSTSDEGRALLKHVRESLGVHHSPDLFHIQQDIIRATSLPLQQQVKQAEKELEKTNQDLEIFKEKGQAYANHPRSSGLPVVDYDLRIEQAEAAVQLAENVLDDAKQRKENVREEARGISNSYHPFDLNTGNVRDAKTVEEDLNKHFKSIEQAANEAGLSEKCKKLLEKAHRLVPQMVATIAFVHTVIQSKIQALKYGEAVKQVMLDYLIPFFYIKEVARKAKTSDVRTMLLKSSDALRERSKCARTVLETLCPEQREALEQIARMCAQIFQRSSSNVEGRNGVLSLRHYRIHNLLPRKLQALTVIHNFWILRSDDSTAAERFFGQSHDDLFDYLLLNLPPPKRSAAQRPRPMEQTSIN